MRVQISSHRVTGSIEVTFRPPSGAESRHVIKNGVHLWIGSDQRIDCALLSPDDEGFDTVGSKLLGKHFDHVIHQVRSNLIEAEETYFDIEVEDSLLENHLVLTNTSSNLEPVISKAPAVSSFEIEFSLRSGDGVPVEVVIDGTPEGLRTAVVHLPESNISTRISEPSQVRVVWNPTTSELKVRLAGVVPGDGRIWVRVALGESGDLLAVDRARVQPDGSAVSSSIVPHQGELGELYVDVTESPTDIIGSSRYRVRRRAARLEAYAADLQRNGKPSEAATVRAKAITLRRSLGEDTENSDLIAKTRSDSKWWIVAVLAVSIGLIIGWFMRGDGSVATTTTTSINQTTMPVQEPSTSEAAVLPSDQSLIAYRAGSTRFFGEGNVNLAAEVDTVGQDSASVRVQVYDQYERSLGQSTPGTQESLMQTCEVRIGSDTGSGGGSYAIQTHIAAYVAETYEDAQLLLTATDLRNPVAEFVGPVSMTANIIESCEVRRIIDQDSVIEIARSAFEAFTLDIPLNSGETYVVLRVINERGSSVSWTSTEVLKIEK
ncbi:MAG: hypothetical protein WCK23_04985 [Actinomycetes bacterium]